MQDDFIRQLRQTADRVLADQPVVLAYLYGSRATDRYAPYSDIDVAIVTPRELPGRERLSLELTLEVKLGVALRGDYDVRVINDAPLTVKGTVVQTGKLLYARDDATRVDFETTVRDMYFDFLPVLRFHTARYFATQRESLRKRGLL